MATVEQRAANAAVTAVSGSAYGYQLNVALFGGPTNTRGNGQVACTNPPTNNLPPGCAGNPAASSSPAVVLPSTGGNQTQTDADGVAGVVGPATFFSSGAITVSTQGTTGASGSVTSSTNVASPGIGGSEAFDAANISSTCTATETGKSGSVTVTGPSEVFLDNGDTAVGDVHPPVSVPVPVNPPAAAPGATSGPGVFTGHIHVNGAVDNFRYVFNEQVMNPDGSITVYAFHQYLLGPTAIGDMFVGKSQCGVTATAATTTTTAATTTTTAATTTTTRPATTTTTMPATTTTTMPATTTTTRPATTTTTLPATTTTTRPATTTTTVASTTTTTRPSTTTTTCRRHCGGGGGGGFFGGFLGTIANLLRALLGGFHAPRLM